MTDKEKAAEISQRYAKNRSRLVAHRVFRSGCAYKRGQILSHLEERKKGWEYNLTYGGDFVKGALKAVNEIIEWVSQDEKNNPMPIDNV